VRRFVTDYEAATGRAVRFRLTFAGSGTQARAIIDGLPVDVAALALPLDIQKISDAGLIDPGWAARLPNRASVCESVVSIVTRRGNPRAIRGWEDLQR
jgi:sulfate transport system substrate-binding protein